MEKFLSSNFTVDSDHAVVQEFAYKNSSKNLSNTENAISLYYAIRDGFYYNPYQIKFDADSYKASNFLSKTEGHCIDKANLLAACARVVGIPSRLGFANVQNHIGTEKLEKQLGTSVLVFHGYTELFLEDQWVKATPAFNAKLCEKLNVKPLEFDGKADSVFQEYNQNGGKFMEYLHDYGTFAEVPLELMFSEWRKHYPNVKNFF